MGFTGAALAFISFLSAQVPEFPVWTRMELKEGTFACYDFEAAKKVVTFKVDCLACQSRLFASEQDKIKVEKEKEELEKALNGAMGAVRTLDQRLNSVVAARDEYATKYVSAYSRDILGGALPWVIAIVATAAVGGAVTVFLLQK